MALQSQRMTHLLAMTRALLGRRQTPADRKSSAGQPSNFSMLFEDFSPNHHQQSQEAPAD
jgi:hypothetical protein